MTDDTYEVSMGCNYCGGEATVVAMTAEGSHAVCPCGRTKITAHAGKPVITVDRTPTDPDPDAVVDL